MKILIVSDIDQEAEDILCRQHEVVISLNPDPRKFLTLIKDREVLIFRSGVNISSEVLSSAPDLKLIVRAGSGTDNIDLACVGERGIKFVRIPGPGAKSVAELTFALMLALARNVLEADLLLRAGKWAKKEMTGHLLTGKSLGIFGAGNIGSRVGQLGHVWGMQVYGCVEHPSIARKQELHAIGIHLVDPHEIYSLSDFLTIHVPLKPSTRYLIDEKALAQMKPGSFLVNMARGGVVNEMDLYHALASGHLAGAALDVHEAEGNGKVSPLAGMRNVVLTPHIGANTFDSQREIGEIVVETVNAFASGKNGVWKHRQQESAARI